jgi:hypothetical protein
MELSFVLEKSHLLELARIRAPQVQERKKFGRASFYFRNVRFNLGAIAVVYVVLLIAFWVVKFVSGYESDGTSLFAGFVAGISLAVILFILQIRALRRKRVEQDLVQQQRFSLKITPNVILLSRPGFEQAVAFKAIGAVTQHATVLIIWHAYGHIVVPRSAFEDAPSEEKFLNMVRGASGSTLN